mgnify:CR=1 FL=1
MALPARGLWPSGLRYATAVLKPDHILLNACGLACQRGGAWLFREVAVELRAGEALWLRGANGSGKTSLLRLLAGLGRPQAGTVARTDGGRMVCIGHADALKDDLSVTEALNFLCRLQGDAVSLQALTGALRRLGLGQKADAPVRTLSRGQRRRVALARMALDLARSGQESANAPLWLLDEPFDALDAQGVQTVNSLLSDHLARGGALVLTSHIAPAFAGALDVPGFKTLELGAVEVPQGLAA